MARTFTELSCHCLISCDGGGGVILFCHGMTELPPQTCGIPAYNKKHVMIGGCCKVCDPYGYQEAKEYYEKNPDLLEEC